MTSQPLSVSSHPLYRQHQTHSFYNITLAICVATFALYKTSQPHFLTSSHSFEDITPTLLDIVSTVSVSSQQIYQYYHSHYMYDITSSICETFCPLYLWHQTHYIWQQPCELITPHSTYVWHHLCYIRRHIHFITPSHNLNDFISNSGMASHPLYQTSHQLDLCHHNLSTDITHTFVRQHTHYICDIICSIYNNISTDYVITLLYLWQQNLDIWNHIQYAVQNIHYPCDITVTSLYHHTHCIESITPTLCMTSHSA